MVLYKITTYKVKSKLFGAIGSWLIIPAPHLMHPS